MKRILLAIFIFISINAFSQNRKRYSGYIGPYPVTLTLSNVNGNITGTYYYDSFDDPISIRGFATGKEIKFNGYDLRGNKLDEFIGQVNQFDIQGIWIGENMQRKYQFKLMEANDPLPLQAPPDRSKYIVSLILFVGSIFLAIVFILFRKRRRSRSKILKPVQSFLGGKGMNHQAGFMFEKYMTDRLDPDVYKLVEWHTEKYRYPKKKITQKFPDLVFERKDTTHSDNKFSIECTYASKAVNKIDLSSKLKISGNNSIGGKPLFIALGLGGKPSKPEAVYMIPADKIRNYVVELSEISVFRVSGSTLQYDPESKTIR